MTIFPTKMSDQDMPVQSTSALSLAAVSKKYALHGNEPRHKKEPAEDFWALKEINLSIGRGQAFGVIGRNGAGKTTLLNIIAGTLAATQGDIAVSGRVVGLFNLGIGFQDELSGRENIFLNGAILGASRKEIEDKLNPIIEFSELGDFINMPLGSYSQGMRLRLGFSIVANLDFDILVIDEVLAVGDALFQNKCFERLIDFKRAGRTLVITTQSMDLIERLCDRVMLLDHGLALFEGAPQEGINRYRNLLNTEKFFVGIPQRKTPALVENTKKWADNVSDWGNKFGGKEITIEAVEFTDWRGAKTNRIDTGSPLKIKVVFTAQDRARNPHFGIAIFRKDGVYCFGPNTEFDGYHIPVLEPGKGYFSLHYRKLWLAPGEYKVSVAIWDKNEALAFDYHYGYYELIVSGPDDDQGGFLKMPFEAGGFAKAAALASLFGGKKHKVEIKPDLLPAGFGQTQETPELKIESLKFLDRQGNVKNIFMTNDCVKFMIGLNFKLPARKNLYLWSGIYRDDGVYCQGAGIPLGQNNNYSIVFPRFALLPGGYRISAGVWDAAENKFLAYQHGVYPLNMVFDRQDHGTIYLEHAWKWGKQ